MPVYSKFKTFNKAYKAYLLIQGHGGTLNGKKFAKKVILIKNHTWEYADFSRNSPLVSFQFNGSASDFGQWKLTNEVFICYRDKINIMLFLFNNH